MPDVTHNTRIAPFAYGSTYSENARPVQAYVQVIDGEDQVWLDLNGSEVSAPLSLTPRDARRLISILRAAITDAREEA